MRFTDEQAMSALRDEVAQYGENYVTPDGTFSCRLWNVENNQPSCLIGAALTRLGIPKDELIAEDERLSTFVGSKFGAEDEAYFSRAVVIAFNEAQWWQDCGNSWGVSLLKAEKKYKECAS